MFNYGLPELVYSQSNVYSQTEESLYTINHAYSQRLLLIPLILINCIIGLTIVIRLSRLGLYTYQIAKVRRV